MDNVLKHQGYVARVESEPDDGLFVGHFVGTEDLVGFHAETVGGLITAFREAVNDYVATCEQLAKALG